MNGIMKGINGEEILTCLILVAIGYFIAKMFSRCSGNGFSVGGPVYNLSASAAIQLCNSASDTCRPEIVSTSIYTCRDLGRGLPTVPADGAPHQDWNPRNPNWKSLDYFCNWEEGDGTNPAACKPKDSWVHSNYEIECVPYEEMDVDGSGGESGSEYDPSEDEFD